MCNMVENYYFRASVSQRKFGGAQAKHTVSSSIALTSTSKWTSSQFYCRVSSSPPSVTMVFLLQHCLRHLTLLGFRATSLTQVENVHFVDGEAKTESFLKFYRKMCSRTAHIHFSHTFNSLFNTQLPNCQSCLQIQVSLNSNDSNALTSLVSISSWPSMYIALAQAPTSVSHIKPALVFKLFFLCELANLPSNHSLHCRVMYSKLSMILLLPLGLTTIIFHSFQDQIHTSQTLLNHAQLLQACHMISCLSVLAQTPTAFSQFIWEIISLLPGLNYMLRQYILP